MSLETAKLFFVPATVWLVGSGGVLIGWGCGVSDELTVSLLASGLVCFAASMIGHWPVARLVVGDAEKVAMTVLVSMMIRGGLSVLGLLALFKLGFLAPAGAAAGCGVWYLAMLIADVWVVLRHFAVIFCESTYSTPSIGHTAGREKTL